MAGNVAARRARGRCAKVSVDRTNLLRPVFVGNEISLYADIVHDGRPRLVPES